MINLKKESFLARYFQKNLTIPRLNRCKDCKKPKPICKHCLAIYKFKCDIDEQQKKQHLKLLGV